MRGDFGPRFFLYYGECDMYTRFSGKYAEPCNAEPALRLIEYSGGNHWWKFKSVQEILGRDKSRNSRDEELYYEAWTTRADDNDFKFDVVADRGRGEEVERYNLDQALANLSEEQFEEFIANRRRQRKLRYPDKFSRALKKWDIQSLGMDGV